MTREDIRIEIARNINQLAEDESTFINGVVTETSTNTKISNVYFQEVFPLLSDKFPTEFKQETYRFPTYTASGTVDSSSTGDSLVTTTSIFTNDMEGFEVENATDDEKATIETYTSGTAVTLETDIDDDWDGDTIYILGNEFTFGGDTTDLKEIIRVEVKYASTDTTYRVCEKRRQEGVIRVGNETVPKTSPIWYPTMVDISGAPYRGFGILPFPDSYAGKIKVTYVERPPELDDDSDVPLLDIVGVSQLIVDNVTAWALRIKKEFDEADRHQMDYEKNLKRLVMSFKPMSRGGASRVRHSGYMGAIGRRYV
jgi:hypothetical protein